MLLSARMSAAFGVSVFALALAAAADVQSQTQTNGIASPLQHVSPTGAVSIPQAEIPSVNTLAPVQPHWVFVNRGGGADGTRIFDGDTGKMKGMVNMYGQDSFSFDPWARISMSPRPSGRSWTVAPARTISWPMTSPP